MLYLQQTLEQYSDIFINSRVKLIRHKDRREEYRELIKSREGLLEYQKEQSKEIFKGCDYIVSFIGQERRRSIFFGVFKVNGVLRRNGKLYYDLKELKEFHDLVGRIVVDWGDGTLSWHQWYHLRKKEIIEILPRGYLGSFPGLLNFALNFDELKKLIDNPEANSDWRHHLSAVNGIYLILDTRTGLQYVGAAYGEKGIWGRWSNYARTQTGGNIEFVELKNRDPKFYTYLRYSILQTLPSNITPAEVIKVETLYKEKLGSRMHGLNSN